MLPIKQNLTTINYNSSSNKTNKYIVVHYTANKTDTAYNNTKYFKSVNRNVSSHYFVDDNDIYQCVLDKNVAWHCGGKKLSGAAGFYGKCTNNNSIGVEMCCTNYGVSAKTEANTIELVKYLITKYNIPTSNVIRHYDVTGKNCPKPMVENPARWNNFKAKLSGQASSTTTTATKPSNSTYKGSSLVDYLKSIGVDSSFTNRSKLAKANGISNYSGTANQNTQLLAKLRGNKTTTTSSTSYYPKYNGSSSSLVDALKSLNINSSFSNRSKIAKANGIKLYIGSGNQNTTLLNLLKQGRLKK